MLVHTRQGVVHVFPAVPETWAEASFEGLRTEGAFLVTAERAFGYTMLVRILSERGALLKLANPFAPHDAARIHADGQSERLTGDVFELPTEPGEVVELRPAPRCG
jgi:alpha-L-fucosidase 2